MEGSCLQGQSHWLGLATPRLGWVTLDRSFTLNLSFHIWEVWVLRPALGRFRRTGAEWRQQ